MKVTQTIQLDTHERLALQKNLIFNRQNGRVNTFFNV